MPSSPFPLPRRWPWLVLTAVIAAGAFFAMQALHARERAASRGELRATVFSVELRDTVEQTERFMDHVPEEGGDAILRPVVAETVRRGRQRVRALAQAVDDSRVGTLQRDIDAIGALVAAPAPPTLKALHVNTTANHMAGTADAIAASQRRRSGAMARETAIGGGLVLVLAVLLVATVLQRSHRLVLRASRRHAAEMLALAEHDPLTGLANRRRLADDLDAAAATATAAAPVQVLMCDLDGFKALNDTLGHEAGDRQLADFAQRVAAAVAPDATAYRLGGDEFCVVSAPGRDVAAAVRAAARPTGAGTLGASVGVALLPIEAGTPRAALRLADERMYASKARRRSAA